MVRYFAYGSCINLKSFEGTVGRNNYKVLGVGRLDGCRLAFTRYSVKRSGGVLDIVPSRDDYVLGVIYEVPDEVIGAIDSREGYPKFYRRTKVTVKHNGREIEVITYMVVNKVTEEICPSHEYFNEVWDGMNENSFPFEYMDRYLRVHCIKEFNVEFVNK